jgi:hypothetical protein
MCARAGSDPGKKGPRSQRYIKKLQGMGASI